MLAGKILLSYINSFSLNGYKYFKDKNYIKASLGFILRKTWWNKKLSSRRNKHNGLMREKCKKTSKHLNYVEHLFILVSAITSCLATSTFASLVCVPVGFVSSAVGTKICAMTTVIKKYKSIIKKKKKKHDKKVLLGKDQWNTIEVLISKALIDSCINHEEFVSVNNVLREYDKINNSL